MNRLFSLVVIAMSIAAVTACSDSSSSRGPAPSVDPGALRIAATNSAFSTSTLSASAGKPFQIAFDNQDGVPHNVALYRDRTNEKVFGEDPFSGPALVTYDVPALQAGTYLFRCDVHTNMSGRLTVG